MVCLRQVLRINCPKEKKKKEEVKTTKRGKGNGLVGPITSWQTDGVTMET